MGRGATLALKITGDASGGIRALDQAEGKTGLFSSALGKSTLVAGAAVAGIVAFGKASYDAASEAQQALGATTAVFGKQADSIIRAAGAADEAVGLSKSSYEQLASVLGAQLNAAGFAGDKLSTSVTGLIGKGSDLAAMFGGTTADAVDALSGVLKGEFDPIEKYGVSLKQSDINARLAALGQDKLTGAALKSATAQAALDIVTKQTASSHGQFAKEAGTAEGATQRFGAWVDNLKASLGQFLLPIVATLANFLRDKLGPVFSKLTDQGGPFMSFLFDVSDIITKQVIPTISGLVQELGPKLTPIFQTVGHIIKDFLIPAFKGIFGYVKQYAIPIFKSVLGPVIAGISLVFHKVSDALEKNKGKFSALYEKVKPFLDFMRDKVAPFIGTVLGGAFKLLGTFISPIIDLIVWVLDKAGAVLGFIGKVGSFLFGGSDAKTGGVKTRGASRVMGATAGGGRLFGASSSLGGGSVGPATAVQGLSTGPTVNITVQGMILDPTALAAQLQGLLDRYATRTGARVALAVT